MRRLATTLLALALVLLWAAPALACINDSAVERSEREFKSTYNEDTPTGDVVPESTPPAENTTPLVMLVSGSVMLAGACLVCLKKPSARS